MIARFLRRLRFLELPQHFLQSLDDKRLRAFECREYPVALVAVVGDHENGKLTAFTMRADHGIFRLLGLPGLTLAVTSFDQALRFPSESKATTTQ
jgi:hypothetical protein